MDIKQLRTFLQVAESGSLSKAALRLRIAQPAVTRQIRMLENSLQTRLFDRHSRGADLTEAGQLFQRRAAAILRDIENTRDEFRARSGSVSGTVALAIAPALVETLLGPLIESYARAYPAVAIALVEGFTGYLEEWLAEGRVDLAILYDPRPDKRLRLTPLAVERLYAVGPPGDTLCIDTACPLVTLAGRGLVTAGRHERLREVIDGAAARAGIALSVTIEANALSIQKSLVRQGLGYAILPLGAISGEVARGELTAAPISDPTIVWPVFLAAPSQARPSIAAAALAQSIEALVVELAARGRYPGLVQSTSNTS